MHHVLNMTYSGNNTLTCARLAPAAQYQRHAHMLPTPWGRFMSYPRWSWFTPGVLLHIYIICCTLSDSFIFHIVTTTDWCRLPGISFVLLRTYASRYERCSREKLSSMRNFIYFSSANTHVPDFLPLPIHQRHVRVANQPVWCEWTKN